MPAVNRYLLAGTAENSREGHNADKGTAAKNEGEAESKEKVEEKTTQENGKEASQRGQKCQKDIGVRQHRSLVDHDGGCDGSQKGPGSIRSQNP